MDPLIEITDFTNPMLVYAKTSGVTNTYFDQLTQRYQKKILEDILGVLLYNDFVDNESELFWDYFVNGVDYTVDGIEYKYLGIKPVLVGFIFYYWQAAKKSSLAEDGQTFPNYKESFKYIPAELMVESWNDSVKEINNNISYYPTVYHFLDNNNDTDIDRSSTAIKKINLFI